MEIVTSRRDAFRFSKENETSGDACLRYKKSIDLYKTIIKVLIYIKQLISKKQKSSSDKNESALLWN